MRKLFPVVIPTMAVLLVLVVACSQTPSQDWNGTWKLNPSKGNFKATHFTISILSDGEYRYDDGYSSFTVRCDGKDQPIENNRTRVCVKSSDTKLDMTVKENSKTTKATHWELSADGKVFAATQTAFRPSGPAITTQIVASRIPGSNGFAGQWQDPSYLKRHANMTVRLDNKILHIAYPGAGQYMDAPLDGGDAAMQGPHPQGVIYTARLTGRREFLILMKRNGSVLLQTSLELSNDGRVITYSWWNPDRPTDKGVFVYEKE